MSNKIDKKRKRKATANTGFASGGLKYKIQQQFFKLAIVQHRDFGLLITARIQSTNTLYGILTLQPNNCNDQRTAKGTHRH